MRYLRRVTGDLAHVDRLVLLVLSILVVTPFGRLFGDPVYLSYAAGAALVALAASVLIAPRRPFVLTLVAAVAGLVAFEVFVVYRITTPLPSDLADVWNSASGSVQSLLGTPLPAVSSAQLMTVPILLAWAACLGGLGLAMRTRFVALVLVPALTAYVGALLFTGQRPVEGPWGPLAIVVASLTIVLVRANARGPEAESATAERATIGDAGPRTPTWLKVGLPALVIATVLGVVAGLALPLVHDDERTDLRDRYQAPVAFSDTTTPLSLISSGHQSTANPKMFTVTTAFASPDHPKIDRVRIASLESYDGAVWATSTRFSEAGDELPAAPIDPASTSVVTQAYVLGDGYRSPFLPAIDRPTTIDQSLLDDEKDPALQFDRQAGMVVVGGAPEPYAGMRYNVTSAVPVVDEAAVRAAPAGNDAAFADLALLPTGPSIPPAISAYASQPAFAVGTPYDMMKAVEKDMLDNFGYSIDTPLDASLASLDRFLAVPAEGTKRRVGDSQQFASALALIARLKNLPSRVVVGYRISGDATTVGGLAEVHAKDIHAWAEVNFRGVGWVPFDGTNVNNPETPKPPQVTTTVAPPPTTRAPQQVAGAAGAPTAQQTCDVVATDCSETISYVVWYPILLLLVLLLIPIVIVLAKWVRRRRRHRGSPTQRAIGAWRETMDRLRAFGVPTSNAMTAAELASSSSDTVGDEAARRLGEFTPVLDTVLYQEGEPGEDLAATAWDAEAGVADAIKQQYGPLARVRAKLDPRPLLRRR